jgi:hypothetical protein
MEPPDMKYNIKAHPTWYKAVFFRSRLEARYAAFFDIVGWKWDYEPIDLVGWTPDFRVEFECGRKSCQPTHSLLAEVKPYNRLDEFIGHQCLEYPYGRKWESGDAIDACASAAFGINPHVSSWEMVHGDGGGMYSIDDWCRCDVDEAWKQAGNVVRYIHGRG